MVPEHRRRDLPPDKFDQMELYLLQGCIRFTRL
jgi:hypothetical protein